MLEINQIHHGDCLDLMHEIPDGSIDMVLADLPYGTTACAWDTVIPLEPLWAHYKRVIKPRGGIVLTGSQPFTSALVMSNPGWFKYEWIWNKRIAGNVFLTDYQPLKIHESVLIFGQQPTYNPQMVKRNEVRRYKDKYGGGDAFGKKGTGDKVYLLTHKHPVSIIDMSNAKRNGNLHPTQKPVALFAYLIRTYTNPGDLVLDNSAGSGTTAIAAIQTGRDWLCIEKDADIYATAANRIAKALGQGFTPAARAGQPNNQNQAELLQHKWRKSQRPIDHRQRHVILRPASFRRG